MKVLLAFLSFLFVVAAIPRFDIIRRRPIVLVAASLVLAASYTSLRVIGV